MDYSKYRYRQRDPKDLIVPILIIAGVLLAAFLAFSSFYTVDPNEKAVVLRFGKIHTVSPPGLHFCIPLVDRVYTVSVEEHTIRLPYAEAEADTARRVREDESLILTGDLNAASVEWTIQWKIEDPGAYIFNVAEPDRVEFIDKIIRTLAKTVMNREVGDHSIDEVLTEKRSDIARNAKDAMQKMFKSEENPDGKFPYGIRIVDLQLQRVTPPAKVKPAFDDVISAIQRRDKLISEAKKEAEQLIPAAEAKKDEMIQAANGYAKSRRAAVAGELDALRAKYAAYKDFPEVTRRRMYLEAMEGVLQGIDSKTIIDADLNKVLPLLPLTEGGVK